MYIKLILSFLPDAFKSQNVSLTDIGEKSYMDLGL